MEHSKRMKKGFEVLRKMGRLGTMMNQKELYPELYDLSVGYLFGEIWTRPHLNIRDRELITLASNIALARPAGTHSHYRSAMHLGFTKEEIIETIIHVGHYAGWPAIAHAILQFEEVMKQDAARAGAKGARKRKKN